MDLARLESPNKIPSLNTDLILHFKWTIHQTTTNLLKDQIGTNTF
jgi:hypothetical protein